MADEPEEEKGVRTYVVFSRYDSGKNPHISAFVTRDHPKRIMALDNVLAFFACDEFNAGLSIREIPTEKLLQELARRTGVTLHG